MKNILLIILLFTWQPQQMPINYTRDKEVFQIQIKDTSIRIVSNFETFSNDTLIPLDVGLNSGYWIVETGLSFEYKLIKY